MKIDNNPFAKGFREKENSGSLACTSPQTSPQSYVPLRMPFCHRPLWIPPLPGLDKLPEAELEAPQGSSSKPPPPPPTQSLPCCWPWPSYYITPKQEDGTSTSTATSLPTYCNTPVATTTTCVFGYSNQA